jgi:hypothetical protein
MASHSPNTQDGRNRSQRANHDKNQDVFSRPDVPAPWRSEGIVTFIARVVADGGIFMAVWPSLASQAADQGIHPSSNTWSSIGLAIVNMPAYSVCPARFICLVPLEREVEVGIMQLSKRGCFQPPMKLSKVARVAARGKSFHYFLWTSSK